MRRIHKLSALKIASLKQPGRYSDGGGLELQVSMTGTKAWIFRFTLHGRERRMGLGSINTISLSEARDRARAARQMILDGQDPLAEKRRRRSDAAKVKTFREVADAFLAAKLRDFRSEKHCAQWRATIEDTYPVLGNMPINDVDTAAVLRVLRPAWDRAPETARRLRGRIERIIAYAIASGARTDESNPCRWRGHLMDLFPKRPDTKHFKAYPYVELPGLMERIRDVDGIAARALELTILCATRTGETLLATWAELDIDQSLWTIDAARTKRLRQHRVPLSDRCLEICDPFAQSGTKVLIWFSPRSGGHLPTPPC